MYDLISRKALLEKAWEADTQCGYVQVVDVGDIEDAPAVDAAPVVWADVIGFDGLYQISNFGECRNNKGVVLKQGIKRTSGTCYKTVNLWKDGKYHKKYIHRMMAEVFIDNPNNYEFVNHKDEDGTNNHLSNLEWCTREYNVNYGTAKERRAKKIRGVPHTKEHKEKISQGLKAYYSEHEAWNKGRPNCGAKMAGGNDND